MRTFWKQAERLSRAARQRGGLLMLVPMLLLCAWFMTDTAYAVKPEQPTYLFEVTTGARTKDGDEDKIDFFIITYTLQTVDDPDSRTDGSEKTVSKFLFPSKDAWAQTYEIVKDASSEQTDRDKLIRDTYGYLGAEISSGKAIFQSYTTDQYLFTTPTPIKEIKRVQVFAGDHGSWACQGMRVFSVDELGGLYRWNDGGSDFYIDFEGDLIAQSTMTMDMNLSWTNDRLISTRTPEKAGNADIALKTSGFDPAYQHHKMQNTEGKKSYENKTLAIRFDFADVYGAGIETNAAMSPTANTLETMGVTENMGVTLYYTDVYGMRRAARVAAMLNGATYAAELLGDDVKKPIGGFAQQGEGLVFSVFLPDYKSLSDRDGITVTLGGSEVLTALRMSTSNGGPLGEAGALRAERTAVSANDTASFVTMAIYDLTDGNENGESVRISASVDESVGAIRYVYSGDPIYYHPVSTASGNNLSIGANQISLSKYEHGKLLAPRDKTERYLFELTTDAIPGAGTKDDILMRVSYTDLSGSAKMSDTINVREFSRDFNGMWHGKVDGVAGTDDIAYYKGVAAGQTLRFFVPMTNVKTIEHVDLWLPDGGSHDDWQMADLAISSVSMNSFDRRAVQWPAFSGDGVTCDVSYDRHVDHEEIYRFKDTADGAVLIQQGADESTDVGPKRANLPDAEGVDVARAKKVDWSEIRYSMSFKQAAQDLGFGKQRCVYAVTVNVGGSSDATAEDGDCGSKNLFYFRLIFQNGSSGFVLANQQLASDGFIAGASQTFNISTNQDYGEVTAVQIIPEDNSEDADVFDKLMIRSIEVKRQSNAALVPVWTINNVGWISIDYRDQSQMQSVTGMAGRGASELTRTYTVDGSTFDINFMIAIQTEGYSAKQFTGNIAARVNYDSYTPSKGFEEIADVTKSIYSYMNRTPIGTPDSIGGKTISDPALMHRAGHTDRFYFSLSDVRMIKSIDFQITSTEDTIWKISNVTLFLVNGEGTLTLNQNGEYERIYRAGEELTELAHGTSEAAPAYSQQLQHYDAAYNTEPMVISVYFTEREIPISPESKQWKSIMSREPVSENDTLNLFVYPQDDARVDPTYGPVASILYTNASDQMIQVSSGDMTRANYNGKTVFYTTGINAKRFGLLNSGGIVLSNGHGTGIQGNVRAIMQQVRSGVVINSWDLAGTGTTDTFGMVLGDRAVTTTPQQNVQIQIGADTEAKLLSPVDGGTGLPADNFAAAFYYRADDPSGMELRTPYIYLTDQGYTQIRPGQVINLAFNQKNVAEITGVALVSIGDLVATVDAVRVVDQDIRVNPDKAEVAAVKGEYSSAVKTTVTNAAYRLSVDGEHTVKPLNLTFATADSATDDVSAGTNGPVRMTLAYYDIYGDLLTRDFDDIRPYIADGSEGFQAGSRVNVAMLLPDAQTLRWIELEPYSNAGDSTAMWTLEYVNAVLGEGEGRFEKRCDVNRQIVEGTKLRLNTADILVTADIFAGDAENPQNVAGGSFDLLVQSGEKIWINPRVVGSYEGFTATLSKVDTTTGAIGRASLDDTRGYTAASIAQRAAAASDSREREIWSQTTPQVGLFEVYKESIEFTPPRNYTEKSAQYQIKIVSVESESSVLTINVTVENESDPVAKRLEELSRTIESELKEKLDNIGAASGTVSGTIPNESVAEAGE